MPMLDKSVPQSGDKDMGGFLLRADPGPCQMFGRGMCPCAWCAAGQDR